MTLRLADTTQVLEELLQPTKILTSASDGRDWPEIGVYMIRDGKISVTKLSLLTGTAGRATFPYLPSQVVSILPLLILLHWVVLPLLSDRPDH